MNRFKTFIDLAAFEAAFADELFNFTNIHENTLLFPFSEN